MSCTINTIRKEAYRISPKVKFDTLGVFVPFDNAITAKNVRFYTAKNEAAKVLKELNERFNSLEFGTVGNINVGYTNGVGISFKVPGKLDKAFELKEGNITAVEFLNYIKENQEETTFEDPEVYDEQDIKDEITYNELNRELIKSLGDEEISYLALQEQEETGMRFAVHKKKKEAAPNNNWKDSRVELIEKLEKVRGQYFNRKPEKVAEINKVINEIREELKEFDSTNKEYIKESILKEVETLKEIITNKDLAIDEIAKSFDVNLVRNRIEELKNQFFHGEQKDIMESRFYNLFSTEEFGYLKSEVTELENIYTNNLERFVLGLISENDIVESALQDKTQSEIEEFFNKIKQLISDLRLSDGGKYSGEVLGDRSYDNVLVELGALLKVVHENRETAIVSSLKAKLDPLFYKLRGKEVNGELLMDKMFKKDIFGVTTDILITPFTDAYKKKSDLIKELRKKFYSSLYTGSLEARENYKNMMVQKKLHFDYIKPYMLASLSKKYKDNPEFTEFFTESEAEMQGYEAEMRYKMGDIAFEISVKKIQKGIDRFIEDSETNIEKRKHLNPLGFVRHFYSEDYLSYDPVRFEYPLPKYSSQIPSISQENYTNYYSPDFKAMERANIEDFKDFYKSVSDILMYIKPRNPNGTFNNIMSLRDDVGREAMKGLSKTGKVKKWVVEALKNLYRGYVDNGAFQNRENLKSYDYAADEQVNQNIPSYGRSEFFKMKKDMLKWPLKEILKEAEETGLKVDPRSINLEVFREELVEAIIQTKLNKSSSLDLLKRIHTQLDVVQSMAARNNALTGYKLILDFIKSKDAGGLNISAHLKTSMEQNIYKIGHRAGTPMGNFERMKWILLPKVYSPAEKELAKIWEKEKENSGDNYTFEYEGNSYMTEYDEETQKLSYYKVFPDENIAELEIEEIDEIYKEYLDSKIDALGLHPITGSIIKGFTSNMYKTFLSVSGITGIKNRMAGFHQNNQAGASGVRGFQTKDLFFARKFLFGVNFGKYTGNRTFSKEKSKQLDIFNTLLVNFNLLDKVYDEITGESTGISKISLISNRFKEFLGDFSMNNPEYHNQGELLLSMLQNVMIQEKQSDGTIKEVPFFNPNTMQLPLDENMKFLPQFDTVDNHNAWLNEEDSSGLSAFIAKYRNVKDKLHGDYSGDKIGMDTSATSKATIAMLKWSFENLNNQWGTKQVSLATGDINIKGRKVVLAEHAPVFATHIAMQNIQWGGIVAGVLGTATGGIMAGAGIIGATLLYRHMAKKSKVDFKMSKLDWGLSVGYLLESLAKTTRTLINSNSLYLLDVPSLSGNEKYIQNLGKGEISERDRAIISESAQEVADRMNTTIRFALLGAGLKWMMTALLTDEDDSPEEIADKMQHYEGYFNYLVNMRISMTTELDQWTDPSKIKSIAESQIFLNFLKRGYTNTSKAIEKFEEGSLTGGEFAIEAGGTVGGLLIGFPGKVSKILKNVNTESYTPAEKVLRNFSTNRVFDSEEKNFLDDYLLKYHLEGEEYYKSKYKEKRKEVRNVLEPIFRKKYISQWRKEGTFTKNSYKLDAVVSKRISKHLKNYGVDARKKPYKVLYERINWDNIIKKAEK